MDLREVVARQELGSGVGAHLHTHITHVKGRVSLESGLNRRDVLLLLLLAVSFAVFTRIVLQPI